LKLHDYDMIIINSSAGKDSLVSIYEVCRLADLQGYPRDKIVVSHQDLKSMEWPGTKELAEKQARLFNLDFHVSAYRNAQGEYKDLLDYVERRGKWPSSKQRYCTSDFKRSPGSRVVTRLTKDLGECKVLYVFGFRKEESPARSKKQEFTLNKRLTTKKRQVFDWLPVHEWTAGQVWDVIKLNNLPYHYAYDLGMPRLSCCFCIFSPLEALIVAGRANPELLDRYIEVEKKINHTFKDKFSIAEVRAAIESGQEIKSINDWRM